MDSIGAVVATGFQCSDGHRFVVKVTDRLTPDHKYWIRWNQASRAIFKPVRRSEEFLDAE